MFKPAQKIATALAFVVLATTTFAKIELADLRCEYRVAPLGIDNTTPRLSWKLVDDSQARALNQTAYQIIVFNNRNTLDNETTPLWDSGKVTSNQSVNIRYQGPALLSGKRYHWKVRIWDRAGQSTDWSPAATFSMGLLNKSDWSGKWIQKADQRKLDHNWFRKNFELTEDATSAFVHLASCGYHELYVNGEKVTPNVMNPVLSFMMTSIPYLTYDITDKLNKGDNVIAVWNAAGWTRWPRTLAYKDAPFAFKAQISIDAGSEALSLHSDETWKTDKSHSEYIGEWDILRFGGERITESRRNHNWNTATFDDSSWQNAVPYTGPAPAKLSAQKVEPQVRFEEVTPIGVQHDGDAYIVDMGRAYTGFFEMEMRNGKANQTVTFEISDIQGKSSNWFQKSEYVYDESGTGNFSNRFNIGAGRWITIRGLDYEPALSDIKGYVITNDRRQISSFESSDDLLNWIYQTNLDTYLANTLDGILMDCPHRERRGWGEVTVAALYGDALPNFESGAYMDQYSEYMRDTQYADGRIRAIINENDRQFLMWKANSPLTLWETYRMLGDKKILADNYTSMRQWMEWLYRNSDYPNGALKAGKQGSREFPGLGDWCTPMGNFWDSSNSPESIHFNNSLYAYMLGVAEKFALAMDDPAQAKIYRDRLAVQQKATHEASYDATTGLYGSGRQVEQLFPLISGVTPDSERKKAYDQLVDAMLYGFPYYDTGSSGQALYTRYLTEYGERMDLVYELLTDTRHPSYGYFRETGATVWPERWSGVGNSRIHTCYTGIGGYFVKGFGGIRPDPETPGMQNFLIKPALVGDLTFANTTYESMYGNIVVNWRKTDETADIHIEIPVNSTAKIYIPAANKNDVFESGKLAENAKGLTYLSAEASEAVGNYVIFKAESGVYNFQSKKLPETSYPAPLYTGKNLAKIGRISASSMYMVSEKNPGYEAFRANDSDYKTRWSAGGVNDQWLEIEWITPQTFNRVEIDEDFHFILKHKIQYWDGKKWKEASSGSRCSKRKVHTFAPVTSTKCRLYIESASQSPSISEIRVIRAD